MLGLLGGPSKLQVAACSKPPHSKTCRTVVPTVSPHSARPEPIELQVHARLAEGLSKLQGAACS